jgi:nitrite reductase/ring-hydroxylating ferredoxin subunit
MTERTHSSTTEPTSSTSTATSPSPTSSTTPSTPASTIPSGLAEPSRDDRISVLTDRRGILRVAGVAGVLVGAGALSACSSPPVPTAAAEPSSSGAGAEASSGATSAAAGGGTPTSEIPVGGGKVFADTKTVVTQPTAGTFKAFDAVCPHQGCTVGSVQDDQIICPCHQSHFDATTGDRVSGPAPTGLTPKTITVTGDTFTVG